MNDFVSTPTRMRRQGIRPKGLIATRKIFGLSQEEMAEEVSKDLRTYQRWEEGKTQPHPRNDLKLQQVIHGLLEQHLRLAVSQLVDQISRDLEFQCNLQQLVAHREASTDQLALDLRTEERTPDSLLDWHSLLSRSVAKSVSSIDFFRRLVSALDKLNDNGLC